MAQPIDSAIKTGHVACPPLQEILTAQPAVLIGLIAHIVGTPLQEEIFRTADRLLRLGQDILATFPASVGGDSVLTVAEPGRDRLRDVLQDPRLP